MVCSLALSVTDCRAPRPQISLWRTGVRSSRLCRYIPVRLFGDSVPVPGLFGGLVGAGCGQFGDSLPVPRLFGGLVGAGCGQFGDSVPVLGLFGGQVGNSPAGRCWAEWLAEGVEFSIFALP